jgi:hypothetical protein
MSLISVLILGLVLCLILYLISTLPIESKYKQIAQGIAVLIAIIWLLQFLFVPISLGNPRID